MNICFLERRMKSSLLIIAAGMGSRYGGLKQIDPVGPNGEIIIDYSMFDAVKAGFEKIVFVIRRSFEDAFKEKIGSKLDGIVETAYAYQELDGCLNGFELPPEREKPWGTGHAILVAKDVIDEPFAVINADDYYGKADRFAWIMVIGRVVSMVDAAILVKLRNRDLTGFGTNPRLTFNAKLSGDPNFKVALKMRF